MAVFYSKADIVRLIVKWRGHCVDNTAANAKSSSYFGDLSPACVGLAINDTKLEDVLAVFNASPGSYRVFNEIHINEGDRNLTVGCGNFATSNLCKMFLDMPANAWDEFRNDVADRIMGNQSYLRQYAADYVVKGYIGNKPASALTKADILASLDYFFARDLVQNGKKKYEDIKDDKALTSRYQYGGDSLTILKGAKSYINLWAGTVLLLASIDPGTGKPSSQYDVYPDYSGDSARIACTRFVNGKEDKSSSPVCARLFPGHTSDNGKCGFWFYAVLYESLLLKSVADWQHRLWVDNFYNECASNLLTLNGTDESILTGLVSWKSSGQTITKNPPFALPVGGRVDFWRNLGDKYYLKSAKEVLVDTKQPLSAERQAMIDACIAKDGELFTGLVLWTQFIDTKKKMRSRQRAMWSTYFESAFLKYKDDKNSSFKADNIKTAALAVTADSVVLSITDKKTGKVHKYTFINK